MKILSQSSNRYRDALASLEAQLTVLEARLQISSLILTDLMKPTCLMHLGKKLVCISRKVSLRFKCSVRSLANANHIVVADMSPIFKSENLKKIITYLLHSKSSGSRENFIACCIEQNQSCCKVVVN